jgi:hypothetical protein
LREQNIDVPKRFLHEHLPALGADADFVRAVAAALDSPSRRQVPARTAAKLDEQRRHRETAGMDADGIVEVEFKGAGRHGHVAQTQHVELDRLDRVSLR